MLTKTLVVYDNSLGQVLRTVARERKDSNNLNGISLKYEVKLSEEAYRILQRHTLIKQEIQLEMIRLVQDLVRTAFATHVRGAPFDADMHTRAQAMLVTGETRVNALIDKHLQRHAEVDGAWKSYYKGQRKELIFAATGLAMSAVSMGLAVPTGGASIAVAVIAGARSLVTGFNKLKECWLTAEEYQVHLKKSIDRLTAAYREGVGVGRLQTLGGAMVNATGITPALELLPRVKGKLLANMGTIDSDMKVYRGKLGSLYAAANELAGTLFDLLDRTESLRLAYPGQQLPQLTKLEREIDELLSSGTSMARFRGKLTISSAYMRYKSGYNALAAIETSIQQVRLMEPHPQAMNRLAKTITVLTNVALTLPNYANALALATPATSMQIAEGMGIATDGVMNTAPQILGSSLGWTGDAMGTGKDLIELAEEFGLGPADIPPPDYAAQVRATHQVLPPPQAVPNPTGGRISRPPNRPPPPVPQASLPAPNRPPPPTPSRPPNRPPPPVPQASASRAPNRPPPPRPIRP